MASYVNLDLRQAPEFDTIAKLAADRFDVPIALVNLDYGDEIWLKAKVGIEICSVPRNVAFCGHVLTTAQPLIVEDLTGDPRFAENPLVTGDLAARFYAGVPLLDRQGSAYGTLCIIGREPRAFPARDLAALQLMASQVEERVELQQLRRSERAAYLIDRTTTDAFVMTDCGGVIEHWNDAAERLLGWTRSEAIGMSVSAIVPIAHRDAHQAGMARLVASPDRAAMGAVEVPALHRDGHEVYVELTLAIHRAPDECAIVSIMRDATARRAMLAEREMQRQLLDAITENMPAAIYAKEPGNGKYLFVNRAYEAMSGHTRADVVGRTATQIFGGQVTPEIIAQEESIIRDETPLHIERQVTTGTGEVRLLATTKVRTQHSDGLPMILGFAMDVTEQRAAADRIAYLAHHDPLTGLLNRTRFIEKLGAAVANGAVGVLCIDLDRFKIVNDLYGHASGDAVLVETANRLREASGCQVARLGGDEFAVLLPDIGAATRIARRCIEALARPFGIHDRGVGIGGSAGIALSGDGPALTADQLMANADLALYRAKREGRNRSCFFEPAMDDAARDRRHIEAQLREAIANGDIRVEYQPLAQTSDGRIVSFEALARWQHAELGHITPALFIPIAEESGLMPALGQMVLDIATREAASWDEPLKIAVNLSPAQLEQDGIAGQIGAALRQSGLAPHRLEIEITEGMLIRDVERGIGVLQEIRALGVSISMDDFGTGYSSLSYFRSFPFDKVKIDQSFIRDMDDNMQSMAIVQAVIRLGEGLATPVVAEGVERVDQFERLKNEGCHIVQGYYIGKPAAIAQYDEHVRPAIKSVLATTGKIRKAAS